MVLTSLFSALHRVKVAHDLVYEGVLSVSKRLRAATCVSSGGVRRPVIVFQAYSVHLAQFFSAVIRELHTYDVDIGFQILCHPHFSRDEIKSLRQFAAGDLAILPERITIYPRVPMPRVHLLVCADVYARFPRRTHQTCIIFHGPALRPRNFEPSPFRKTVYHFDKAIVSGPFDLRQVEIHAGRHRKRLQIEVGGVPFLDSLTAPALSKAEYFKTLALDTDRPTVLIGPHWEGMRLARDQDPSYFETLINALSHLPVNLLVKLHRCSYNPIMSGGVNWREHLERMTARGRIQIDPDPDDRCAIAYSDILVTDISSRAFIFMLLGKPVIHYFPVPKSWGPSEGPRLERIREGSLVAKTVADIPHLVLQAQRRGFHEPQPELAADCIAHFGQATETVVNRLLLWARDTAGV